MIVTTENPASEMLAGFFNRARPFLPLDPEFAAYLTDRTEGHPLFAVQLLGHWIERDVFDVEPTGFVLSDARDVDLPDDIHHLWVERVGRLREAFSDSVARARDHLEQRDLIAEREGLEDVHVHTRLARLALVAGEVDRRGFDDD